MAQLNFWCLSIFQPGLQASSTGGRRGAGEEGKEKEKEGGACSHTALRDPHFNFAVKANGKTEADGVAEEAEKKEPQEPPKKKSALPLQPLQHIEANPAVQCSD